jgi:2-polyprenyl-3-methyl-5-hydroxy-6-metoxy-1,4-benzoquinol methylase
MQLNDELILRSWNKNAQAWISAIENEEIESRIVTNDAIINAIMNYSPNSILDIGCGEGWLTSELTLRGIDATGIDVVPALIENAQTKDCGKFLLISYENIATSLVDNYFDAAVCNFSLLGKESVDNLLYSIPPLLTNKQLLFIQTLHPIIACSDTAYTDGWRQETWNGFNSQFQEAAPWYFRTLETWVKLLQTSGFSILECREPINPKTQKPASIIFITQYK